MGMRRKRTNIELDVDKVERIMERYELPTMTAAVDYALERVAGRPMTWEEVRAMRGSHALWDDFPPEDEIPPDL